MDVIWTRTLVGESHSLDKEVQLSMRIFRVYHQRHPFPQGWVQRDFDIPSNRRPTKDHSSEIYHFHPTPGELRGNPGADPVSADQEGTLGR
jgi:hypothetical protein